MLVGSPLALPLTVCFFVTVVAAADLAGAWRGDMTRMQKLVSSLQVDIPLVDAALLACSTHAAAHAQHTMPASLHAMQSRLPPAHWGPNQLADFGTRLCDMCVCPPEACLHARA